MAGEREMRTILARRQRGTSRMKGLERSISVEGVAVERREWAG
jgi:hypothetical protein